VLLQFRRKEISVLSLGFGVSQAATTANLLIKGTVPRLLEISVSSLAIATVNEKSNSKTGYKRCDLIGQPR
jgi:hypothetical protein